MIAAWSSTQMCGIFFELWCFKRLESGEIQGDSVWTNDYVQLNGCCADPWGISGGSQYWTEHFRFYKK